MKKEKFRLFLKRRGKKDHVIDGLIAHVVQLEKYLEKSAGKILDQADAGDLHRFIEEAEKTEPGRAKKLCRGIGLYYKFDNNDLYKIAKRFRDAEVKKTRTDFLLKNFQGINAKFVTRLAASGIRNTTQMLKACKTPADRKALAKITGIPNKAILELVKLSDLARIRGVKSVRARLYCDAGIDSVEKMAQWDADRFREFISAYIESSGFDGAVPLPKEIQYTIDEARKLKPVLEY